LDIKLLATKAEHFGARIVVPNDICILNRVAANRRARPNKALDDIPIRTFFGPGV